MVLLAWPAGADGDRELEDFLETAPVVSMKGLHGGVTMPYRCTLRRDGDERRAILKTVDLVVEGEARVGDTTERGFTDRYHYEIAAYRLDRLLGLGMVPVTVFRNVAAQPGSLQAWVEDAMTEEQRRAEKAGPEDPDVLDDQRRVMVVFDALIANTDRHEGNMLYTRPSWKLHLIDHSRAFRNDPGVPGAARRAAARLPSAVLRRLRALDRPLLATTMEDLLDGDQIGALLKRRDALLERVAVRREVR